LRETGKIAIATVFSNTSSDFARRRRDMTDAEKVMWRLLRSCQLDGFKFRGQEPIARYIVDFVCFAPRLVVEIDRGPHNAPSDYEDRQTDSLTREGFEMLRFWNNEVLEKPRGRLRAHPRCVARTRRSTLPPLRGGPLPLP